MNILDLAQMIIRHASEYGNHECTFGSELIVEGCITEIDFDIRSIEFDDDKFTIYGERV